jgi:hypothetical protein
MHIDALGKNIEIDDYVAYPQSNKLMLGRVAKLANKMVVIESVIKKRKNKYTSELKEIYRKYPNDCVIVDKDAGLTMYVIRNS